MYKPMRKSSAAATANHGIIFPLVGRSSQPLRICDQLILPSHDSEGPTNLSMESVPLRERGWPNSQLTSLCLIHPLTQVVPTSCSRDYRQTKVCRTLRVMTRQRINWYKYAAPANFYPLAGR